MLDLNGIEPGEATADDSTGLLELINLVQPHVPWNQRHLNWQFFEPPAGPARLFVLRDAEKIVSLYSAVRYRLRVGDDLHQAWMVQDVMSHPAYRGRGFLNYLGQLCFDEIRRSGDAGYTFPNKLSEGSFRRSGWGERMRIPKRSCAVGPVDDDVGGIHPLVEFTSRHAELWRSACPGIGVERDADYLRWRYTKPGQTYHRFSIGDDRGYLVLKIYEGAPRTAHICDLVLRPSAHGLIDGALRFAKSFAARNGATRLTAWLPATHPASSAMDGAGLELEADVDRFMFTLGPASGEPWHLTQGDSDVY